MRDAMIGLSIIGVLSVMLLAALLLHTPWSSWIPKDDLIKGKTVDMQGLYYAQYSAVRRFPK